MSHRRTVGGDEAASRPLALVASIGRILFQRRPTDPRPALQLAFEHLGVALSLKAVATVRFEPGGDLTITGTWVDGGVIVDTAGVVVPASDLPRHRGLRTRREPMVCSSEEFGPVYGALLDNLGEETSLLGVPVISGGAVVGAMVVVGARDREWVHDLLVALSVVAETVWGFLGRCEIEEDLRERAEVAELLAEIAGYLNGDHDRLSLELLDQVLAEIGLFTGADTITTYEIRDDRAVPRLHWRSPDGPQGHAWSPSTVEITPDEWLVPAGHPVAPFAPGGRPSASELTPPGTAGVVAVELVGGDVVGAFVVAHDASRRLTPAQLDLVGGVVDLFGQFRSRLTTDSALARRRRIDAVRAEIAAMFVESTADDADDVVLDALARLGQLFDSQNVNWVDVDQDRSLGRVGVSWIGDCDGGVPVEAIDFRLDPEILRGHDPHVMTVGEVATRAGSAARRPMLVVPAAVGDRTVGALALELSDSDVAVPDDEIATLVDIGRLVHQVRERAADELVSRRREELDDLQLELASRFLDPDADNPKTTLQWALRRLGMELGADVVSLVEYGRDGSRELNSWAASDAARELGDHLMGTENSPGAFSDDFVLSGEPIVVTFADLPPALADLVESIAGDDLTMVAAPRRGSGADLALSVTVFADRAWTGDEIAALRHVAGQLRQYLDTQIARRHVERHLALDGLITSASARLVESEDPDHETLATTELVGEFFDARSVAWVDVDHGHQRLTASHVWQAATVIGPMAPFMPIDLNGDAWEDMWTPMVHPFVVHGRDLGEALQPGAPESLGFVHVVVPVVVRGRPQALLVIQTDDDLRWTETELSALNSLATVVYEVLDRDRADRLFSTTFRSAPTGQLLVAADGRILAANESFAQLVGVDPVGLALERFFEYAATPAELVAGEVQIAGVGSRPWTRVRTAEVPLAHAVEPVTVVHVEDATADRRNRERLQWEATHDDLTGLANRRVLMEELERSMMESTSCAILMIDVDRFKVVNDSLGHTAGDSVLVRIADRLKLSLRSADLVSRFGGDEFAVLVRDQNTEMELAATARRLIELLRMPVDIDGTAIIPTCSVGIAAARAGDDVEAVMRHADAALYEAKTRGRDRYEFFDDARRELIQDRLRVETSLRRALLDHQFVAWFQPEHDLDSGAIIGVEALVRWDHPERGVVAAHEFIDVAEDMGLAPQLSRMVLDHSLVAVRRWLDAGHPTRVRVNVAAAQLQSAELQTQICDGLERCGLAPEHLCIEITERSLMLDPERAASTLERVRAMGVEVAVDDFGTGFSSLARLKDLPVDTLKIDRSFIDGIVDSSTDREIVQTIIGLGRGLGLDIVAEGVETEAQADLLRELGCHRAQGWLWSRAMPDKEILALLEHRAPVR